MKRSSRAGRLTQLERNQRTTGIFFILPSLVLCAIFMVVPLINVIRYSLTDWDGLSKTYNFVGLYNYMHLHEIEGFGEMMLATVTFAIGVTAITIIVSFLAALALDKRSRDRLPRGLMRALWFFPALLSGAVVGILWRIMYNYNNGVINKIITSAGLPAVNWLETRGVTNIAIIIGAAWVQIGLCVVVFLAGLQSIPQEMYEAASEIYARLIRDDIARHKTPRHPQAPQAKLRGAGLIRVISDQVFPEVFHVVHVKSHVVSESVRHEKAGDAFPHHVLNFPADYAERPEVVEHVRGDGKMHVAICHTRAGEAERQLVALVHGIIYIPLLRGVSASCRIGAGEV